MECVRAGAFRRVGHVRVRVYTSHGGGGQPVARSPEGVFVGRHRRRRCPEVGNAAARLRGATKHEHEHMRARALHHRSGPASRCRRFPGRPALIVAVVAAAAATATSLHAHYDRDCSSCVLCMRARSVVTFGFRVSVRGLCLLFVVRCVEHVFRSVSEPILFLSIHFSF